MATTIILKTGERWRKHTSNIWVSDYGRVWRIKATSRAPKGIGHGRVQIRKQKTGRSGNRMVIGDKLAHRIIAKLFIPNPQNKATVDHKDHDATNNHISNLRWFTQQEQNHHKRRHSMGGVNWRDRENTWVVNWRDSEDGRNRSKQPFATKEEGQKWLKENIHIKYNITDNDEDA
jgi:hypothetical protein